MIRTDVLAFHRDCADVVRFCPDEYARSYAYAGLNLEGHEEVTTQCLYILNNVATWRGERARAIKADLRRISKLKP